MVYSNNSAVLGSALTCAEVRGPASLFSAPPGKWAFEHLHTGCPRSANFIFDVFVLWRSSILFVGWAPIPLFFISQSDLVLAATRVAFCSHNSPLRLPWFQSHVVVHRHDDDPGPQLRRMHVFTLEHLLRLGEILKCCVSWVRPALACGRAPLNNMSQGGSRGRRRHQDAQLLSPRRKRRTVIVRKR